MKAMGVEQWRPEEVALLKALGSIPQKPVKISELVKILCQDQSLVTAAAVSLSQKGLVQIQEEEQIELARGPEWDEKLPERKALEVIAREFKSEQDTISLSQLPALLNKADVRSEVKFLLRKGWCEREAQNLRLSARGKEALAGKLEADEIVVQQLREKPVLLASELQDKLSGVDIAAGINLLKGRDGVVKIKKRIGRLVSLTQEGAAAVQKVDKVGAEVTQLTPEMLATGKWREVSFRRYDVTLGTKPRYPGKEHPLQRIIQEARRAFFELGFEEVSSPVVEVAFWDFDALFQPQDHPAREMQDTFYLAKPARGSLPAEELVRRVAEAHERGGDTGSRGWRYHWDQEQARRLLLRTHTTAATIRALAQNPNPPRKVFCIGKVFRRENIDATHLPEFTQLDGIIIDDHASLVTLFGTLAEFYRKMGAHEVRFRPSYFPYTEPSVEVFANLGSLGWVEMGGAGVFRQEVVKPLRCQSRVLAWGLGLERLAMMRFGVQDIRRLYWADINWLREAKLCR
ncbi:MAG: phenylalanine--tRNA ligase subunit alpha [candidate division WOR-3 bacterium]|nr:phenylalanine--tRNA ligase subunit alpha [candidate division WOR-3 bacterium]